MPVGPTLLFAAAVVAVQAAIAAACWPSSALQHLQHPGGSPVSTHVLPGLVDVHVHLRNPGGEHKETVATGTAAALAGGVTAVLAMPNTSPPIVDAAVLDATRALLEREALCDVGVYLGATDDNAAAAAAAAGHACGLKVYANDTFGPLRIESLDTLAAHFEAWPRDKPIVMHAEEMTTATAIALASIYDRSVHIAHVSRGSEMRLIAAAKDAGMKVTCEVAPHHLFLTDADAERLGTHGLMRPPLAPPSDRAVLWELLDYVDCIATDHAPHTRQEKAGAKPPPGVPGLEVMLPLMLTAVYEDRLTLERLVELTSSRPAELFGIETPRESVVDVEIGGQWVLPERGYQTKVDWSPYAGLAVRGRVVRTSLRDEIVWEEGEIRARPGTGRLLF